MRRRAPHTIFYKVQAKDPIKTKLAGRIRRKAVLLFRKTKPARTWKRACKPPQVMQALFNKLLLTLNLF